MSVSTCSLGESEQPTGVLDVDTSVSVFSSPNKYCSCVSYSHHGLYLVGCMGCSSSVVLKLYRATDPQISDPTPRASDSGGLSRV